MPTTRSGVRATPPPFTPRRSRNSADRSENTITMASPSKTSGGENEMTQPSSTTTPAVLMGHPDTQKLKLVEASKESRQTRKTIVSSQRRNQCLRGPRAQPRLHLLERMPLPQRSDLVIRSVFTFQSYNGLR